MNLRNTPKRPNRFTRINNRKKKQTFMARQHEQIQKEYQKLNSK